MKKIGSWMVAMIFGLIFMAIPTTTRRLEVQGKTKEKIIPKKNGLLIISNHSSFLEPVVLPTLSFPRYFLNLKMVPVSLTEKRYYDNFLFSFLRRFCISINAKNHRTVRMGMKEAEGILKRGGIVAIFPEGTRTFNCERLNQFRISKTGKKLGTFKRGIEQLILKTDCDVLPIWIDGGERVVINGKGFPEILLVRFWRKIKVLIGERYSGTKSLGRKNIAPYFEDIVLGLSDNIK